MAHPEFVRAGWSANLAHVNEEAAEVIIAISKINRFGPFSVNPLLPVTERVPNITLLHREMQDLREAMDRLLLAWPEEEA